MTGPLLPPPGAAAPALPTPLAALMEAAGAVGLVVTKAEGGWIASVEEARGSWRDGPVCVGPDEAVVGVLVVREVAVLLPPPY